MTRTRIETVLAAAFAILALVTVMWPTWIEAIFGVDPDAGSGVLEWAIVASLGVLAAAAALLARRHYRAARATQTS
jgi:hypothetical protein